MLQPPLRKSDPRNQSEICICVSKPRRCDSWNDKLSIGINSNHSQTRSALPSRSMSLTSGSLGLEKLLVIAISHTLANLEKKPGRRKLPNSQILDNCCTEEDLYTQPYALPSNSLQSTNSLSQFATSWRNNHPHHSCRSRFKQSTNW